MKQKFILLAATFFASYPKQNTIYFTTDEQAFFDANDALNHAKSIREKKSDEPTVIIVSREEAQSGKEETPADTTAVNSQTKEDAQATLDKAKAAVEPLKAAWDEKKGKLDASPDNKNFQAWEASAKAKYDKAVQDVADAETALQKFVEAEKN